MKILEIISAFPPREFIGDKNTDVNELLNISSNNDSRDVLYWCSIKNIEKLREFKTGTIIIPTEGFSYAIAPDCNYIIVENPRKYFNDVLLKFFWTADVESSISDQANIAASVKLGEKVFIGSQVVIKDNCIIGDHVRILNNTFIYPGTIIGDYTTIGANNIIGNYGFGYERDVEGNYRLMPHIGNVIIGSHVEIGNNNCIDRAVLGSTIIDNHTKIHNFVQIAHGVQIGKNCLVTANVTISGSTKIGNEVWIGPGATIANKLLVGDHSYLSMGSVIFSDVPAGATLTGNPARIIKSSKS